MRRLRLVANITDVPKELGTVIATYKGADLTAAISFTKDSIYCFDMSNTDGAQLFPLNLAPIRVYEEAEQQVIEGILRDSENINRRVINTSFVDPNESSVWERYKHGTKKKKTKYYKDDKGDYLNDNQTIVQVIIYKQYEQDVKAFLRESGFNDYLETYSIVPMEQEVFDKFVKKKAYNKYRRTIKSRLKKVLLAYDYNSVEDTMEYKIADGFLVNMGDNVASIYFTNETENESDSSGAGFILSYNGVFIAFDKDVEAELATLVQKMESEKRTNRVYMFEDLIKAISSDQFQHIKQFGYFDIAEQWILNQSGNTIKSRVIKPNFKSQLNNDQTWENYLKIVNPEDVEEESKDDNQEDNQQNNEENNEQDYSTQTTQSEGLKPEDLMVVRIHCKDSDANIAYFKEHFNGPYKHMVYKITTK